MPLQMSDLKALLDQDNIRYFEDARRNMVLVSFGGSHGSYQIVIGVQDEGHFLQYRTLQFGKCPADSPHTHRLHKLLATFNYTTRWVKWAWDPSDGEVVATGDMWVMDAALTRVQFQRMLNNMLQVLELQSPRIRAMIDTGKDPGEPGPADPPRKPVTAAAPVTEI